MIMIIVVQIPRLGINFPAPFCLQDKGRFAIDCDGVSYQISEFPAGWLAACLPAGG